MIKPYQKYILLLIIVFLINSILISFFNFFIDPYGVMNSPRIHRLNQAKPTQDSHVRLFKAIDIIHRRPTVLILGSSRTDRGIDPIYLSDILEVENQSVYNLAILGSNMYETMRYFQHALENQPNVKKIVLGIDFFMFNQLRGNEVDFEEYRLEKRQITPRDTLNVLYSMDAFTSSWVTIDHNRKHPDGTPYTVNGFRDEDYLREHFLINQSILKSFRLSLKDYFQQSRFYNGFILSPEALENLKTIIETCQERGIELKVFISPSHVTQWEAIYVAGLWPVFEEWKREVVKITPVWDFSGYHEITMEPLSNKMKNYLDNSHYRPQIGNLVLDRLFNISTENIPSDFGVFLTEENLENHLTQIRQDRENWAKDNASTIEFVSDIYQQVKSTQPSN